MTFTPRKRFARYLERDDKLKERLLTEIARGKTEEEALAAVNDMYPDETRTLATARAWVREDPEFAQALRVARTKPPAPPGVVNARELEDIMANIVSEGYRE